MRVGKRSMCMSGNLLHVEITLMKIPHAEFYQGCRRWKCRDIETDIKLKHPLRFKRCIQFLCEGTFYWAVHFVAQSGWKWKPLRHFSSLTSVSPLFVPYLLPEPGKAPGMARYSQSSRITEATLKGVGGQNARHGKRDELFPRDFKDQRNFLQRDAQEGGNQMKGDSKITLDILSYWF